MEILKFLLPLAAVSATASFLSAQNSQATAAPPVMPALSHTSTWLGNSHGQGDGKWIQNNILGLHVSGGGTVYTNSWWDEGRRESGFYSGKDGDPIGMLNSLHDSFGGGFAVTGDDQFIYASNWDTVRRCTPDGAPAPFPGGMGKQGDSFDVSTAPTGKDKMIGVRGLAIDSANQRIFVAESTDNELEVWDLENHQLVKKWTVERPGHLACARDGSVWMVSRREGDLPAKILNFKADGTKLPAEITGGPDFDPTGVWFDGKSGSLLVADNGPDQQVKIYRNLSVSTDTPSATFGSSVYSGTPGEITAAKFGSSGLTGVATDPDGNYYISFNGVGPHSFWHGGGTVLESRTPSGELRWRKLGLTFVDCADADPASDTGDTIDVYDKYSRYRLDLRKTSAGTEWTYVGRTLNPVRYPKDQRFLRAPDGWDYTGGTFVRSVEGHQLLYVVSMQARRMLIYRFSPADGGETAIPAGIWESQAGYKAGYPGSPPGGDFIWRDRNGNGGFDADEFAAGPGMPNLGYGMWVDSNGDLFSCNHWSGNGIGIRAWCLQGFDEHGNPIYDYQKGSYTEFPRPEGSHGELRRIEYFPESDTMYVASTSRNDGDRDAGNRIVRYDHWSSAERSIAWTLDPPMDSTKISSISVAGDYLFLGYSYFSSNGREGTIRIHRLSDASYVGELTPTPAVGSLCGTFDIPYAIRARRTRSGEYLIFAEDDHYAKVIVHRWNPNGSTVVDTLDDLRKTDPALSSKDWSIDTSNKQYFDRDGGRASRSADTPQHLVWTHPALSNFSISLYFDVKLQIDAIVGFSSSTDGRQWTPVKTFRTPSVSSGGGWNVSTFRPENHSLPEDTRHLKLDVAPTGTSWNLQVGRVELFGGRKPSTP